MILIYYLKMTRINCLKKSQSFMYLFYIKIYFNNDFTAIFKLLSLYFIIIIIIWNLLSIIKETLHFIKSVFNKQNNNDNNNKYFYYGQRKIIISDNAKVRVLVLLLISIIH